MAERALINTADDFGLSIPVNEAVEEAHRKGVLTCASLVVAGDAAEDAIRRARKMPNLGVGLHLALLDAPSALPAAEIPDLTAPDGSGLASRPFWTGSKIALVSSVRAQARAEAKAQFELFRRTGLALDHVDGHWHFHQHPALIGVLVELAQAFGVRAVRVPNEPALPSWRAAGRKGLFGRLRTSLANAPLWGATRARLRRSGIGCNDWFFGLNDGGAVTSKLLLGLIANLPPGISEIGMHPASAPLSGPHAPPAHWRVVEELQALVDPEVAEACRRVRLGRFADFLGGEGRA
jgi:hopanoid biosynthesis associated protein HpnK